MLVCDLECVSMYRMYIYAGLKQYGWQMVGCGFVCVYLSRISFWPTLAPAEVCLSGVAQGAGLKLSAPSPLLQPTRDSS